MLVIILISLLFIKVLNTINPINYCDSGQVHAVFNYGWRIAVRSHDLIWFYDDERHVMKEPPESALQRTDSTGNDDLQIITTLFISRTPSPSSCVYKDRRECDKVYKALDLLFIKYLNLRTRTEFTSVIHITVQEESRPVSVSDYPWNLGTDLNMWPNQWNDDPSNSKPSAFLPINLDALFIAHSGNTRRSAILWNSVKSNTWMHYLKSVPISSDINFVGIFFLRNTSSMYAIGDRPGDPISRVYLIAMRNSTYFIGDTERTAKEFFGCIIETTTTESLIVINPNPLTVTPKESIGPTPGENKDTIIIIVIIVIFLIFGLIALIVALVLLRTQDQQSKLNSSQSGSDNASQFSGISVATVDSDSGKRVKN